MVSGVAGGLGEYFGVDPVIFRVLFAVLSFFGGVGLLMYGLAWLLIPEPGRRRVRPGPGHRASCGRAGCRRGW